MIYILNAQTSTGMSPPVLILKKNVVIMLSRNWSKKRRRAIRKRGPSPYRKYQKYIQVQTGAID